MGIGMKATDQRTPPTCRKFLSMPLHHCDVTCKHGGVAVESVPFFVLSFVLCGQKVFVQTSFTPRCVQRLLSFWANNEMPAGQKCISDIEVQSVIRRFLGEEMPQILDVHFQVAPTSEHGWVPLSELQGQPINARRSAIADCTARRVSNVKRASYLFWVGALRSKFYANLAILWSCCWKCLHETL